MVDPISIAVGLGEIMSSVGGAVASGVGALGTAGGLGTAAAVAGAGAGIYGAVEAGQAAKKAGGVTVNTPSAPPAAPPIQNPVGSQTSNTGSGATPSFLAAAATPQTNQTSGQRSLLGQ
jgi:hypothetical protein